MTSNESHRTAAFTLPAGSTEYAFFPGGWRDLSSTNIWLATGQILGIVCDSEVITGSGFVLDVHDRFDHAIHGPEDEICFFVFDAPSSREAALVAERAALDPIRVVEAVSSERSHA